MKTKRFERKINDKFKMIFWVALGLVMMGQMAFADNIGYIDTQRIFRDYKEARQAEEDFQKKQEDYQKELESQQKKLDKARAKNKKEEDIQKLIEKIEEDLKPQQEELLRYRAQLTQQLQQKIIDASAQVSKEYGIDVILDKQVVLVGGFDLTDFVLEKLNRSK